MNLNYCKSEAAGSLLRTTIRYIKVGSLGISVNRTKPQIHHHPIPSHPILSTYLPIHLPAAATDAASTYLPIHLPAATEDAASTNPPNNPPQSPPDS